LVATLAGLLIAWTARPQGLHLARQQAAHFLLLVALFAGALAKQRRLVTKL
jgi:hypothetical protein